MNTVSMSEARGASYGDFRKMAHMAQNLKAIACSNPSMSSVQKEAMELICTKIARIANGDCNCKDSWADISGYADLVVVDLDRPAMEGYNSSMDRQIVDAIRKIDRQERATNDITRDTGSVPAPWERG